MNKFSGIFVLAGVSLCLVIIFGAGTCLFEEIFHQKSKKSHLDIIERIWGKIILLFFGIIATLVLPLLLINKLYDLEISLLFLLSREAYLCAYYSVCVLIWVLIFLVEWRRRGIGRRQNFIKTIN
jgi:hypothetical protein